MEMSSFRDSQWRPRGLMRNSRSCSGVALSGRGNHARGTPEDAAVAERDPHGVFVEAECFGADRCIHAMFSRFAACMNCSARLFWRGHLWFPPIPQRMREGWAPGCVRRGPWGMGRDVFWGLGLRLDGCWIWSYWGWFRRFWVRFGCGLRVVLSSFSSCFYAIF